MKSIKNISKKILQKYSCVIILTDHDNINYNLVLKNSKIIFDTRGVYESIINNKIIKI